MVNHLLIFYIIFLYNNGHEVSVVNPSCINAFAKSKLSRHKTDKVDSMIIAEFAIKNDLTPYIPTDKALQYLQDLYRCMQNLKKQHAQTQNYLEHKQHLPKSICTSYAKLAKHIKKEIENIELEIDKILTNNTSLKQKADNMQTIPGIGKATAIAILAEAPDLESFSNARQLAAYAGLTPKHKTSGTSVRGKTSISKIGSSNLRKALYFPAIVAKKHNPLFKEFTQKLSSKGKPAKVIIVAIMRKLLHIIFGVVKNKTSFNPNLVLDS
ncbi:IS110 family transposase [Candidatus Tisiphia endosymbiont of Metellina segmentata]|uniref:IS110 family transposase n=1 Tax=Candidatus Tisiphia endosymbiont of Metellina segmentata TaxID=3066274 RepID=UPI00313B48A0